MFVAWFVGGFVCGWRALWLCPGRARARVGPRSRGGCRAKRVVIRARVGPRSRGGAERSEVWVTGNESRAKRGVDYG